MQVLTQAFDRDDIRQAVDGETGRALSRQQPARSRRSPHPRVGAASRSASRNQCAARSRPRSSPSTASAFTSTASAARRPAPSSTSAKTTPRPPATLTAMPSTASPTRAASPCTWRECAHSVTAVDSSRPALEVAEQNEQLNRDAHTLWRDRVDRGQRLRSAQGLLHRRRQYDTIVLDPPAFAKTKRVGRNRAPRLQGAESARPEDAAAGRAARHLLLFVPRGTVAVPGDAGHVGRRCWPPRADPRKAGSGHRPSRLCLGVPETAISSALSAQIIDNK